MKAAITGARGGGGGRGAAAGAAGGGPSRSSPLSKSLIGVPPPKWAARRLVSLEIGDPIGQPMLIECPAVRLALSAGRPQFLNTVSGAVSNARSGARPAFKQCVVLNSVA